MRPKIPEFISSAVIRKYLEGKSRNKIAVECNISQGAVSAIIDNWKKSEGVSLAEQLRELLLAIGRSGISVVECAQGYRTLMQLRNLGIDEDKAEPFLVETITRCSRSGISPQDIPKHLEDYISFIINSGDLNIRKEEPEDDNDNDISQKVPSILQIAKYLEKTKEEIRKSELRQDYVKDVYYMD